jgi:DNA-binding CsgD family transcriptional regulator
MREELEMVAHRVAGPERVEQEIIRLCHAGLDTHTLRCEVFHRIQRVIPYATFWCATTDPATMLFTSAVMGGTHPLAGPGYLTNELLHDDFLKFGDLARSRNPVGTLQMATGGDLTRSRRYREFHAPAGLGHEMRAVFRSGGAVWGGMCLHREQRDPDFTPAQVTFIAGIAPHLAAGLRTALLLGAVESAFAASGPGLLLLADDLSIIAATPAAELLLAEAGETNDWPQGEMLPLAVLAVVAQLHTLERFASEPDLQASSVTMPQISRIPQIPRARLRTRAGRWLVAHASRLAHLAVRQATQASPSGQPIAVIIEQATPHDVAPLVLQAYALSARELEVAQLVLAGRATDDIAAQLCISTLTVQQHLKAIFDKMGVRSRRELVAQVFAQTYWPAVAADLGIAPEHWSPT